MANGSRELESPPVIIEEGSNPLLQGTTTRGCFCFTSRRRGSGLWDRIRTTQVESGNALWARGVRAFQKIREWSELVAGPRWKTFIRRFNRNRGGGSGRSPVKLQLYDPLSYTLNFDQGSADDDNTYGGFRSFSVRYAAVPSRSGKATAVVRKDLDTAFSRAEGDNETCGGGSQSFS